MRIEWARPGVLRVTSHAYEFAALVAAGRYVAGAAPVEVPAEALERLRRVLDDYDAQISRLRAGGAAGRDEEEP
ncbi:hypothetical protein AF335_01920 [Streptomyces eurocidicus]|uniref:Uncharacterized protein n=1 Tax=Streptomyces eurocidicus TaxID=66423 RepID=A0A2N8P2B6_STREU|nr:hypothetical protein [Streptomyces eurocidicus]MBB5121161.1 hypothetical protein [Streptomyces eurocidicus]MBF6054174.1 hypothetical protein [Streptomyces eurocidicus]PNE35164.1 hypothetical protein AF335_01920 [Streptomyces eurocidicus]